MAEVGTAQRGLDWMRWNIGIGEHPDGSNTNAITDWFGMNGQPWCAMTVSAALNMAFGNPDRWQVPGVASTYPQGTAYVPAMVQYFKDAGLFGSEPHVGDVVFYAWTFGSDGDHVGLVEQVVGDGTIVALEGNQNNDLVRIRRSPAVILGYGYPPYDPEPGPQPETTKEIPEMLTYAIQTPDGNGKVFLLRSSGQPVFLAKGSDVDAMTRAHVPHAGEISVDLHQALLGA
jgi:hypothetical protein